MTAEAKTACDRCGTCCRQGGPALHGGDRDLVVSGALAFDDLITVRRGELALPPLGRTPLPVRDEFVKIRGRGRDWCCKFYDAEAAACTIYENRPLACALLDCTAPAALLSVAGRDLLTRFDCIPADDPCRPLVALHERECPCPDLAATAGRLRSDASRDDTLRQLARLVEIDLAIRGRAVRRYDLPVARELFYFGRPLFRLLIPLGVRVTESCRGMILHWEEERSPTAG